MAKDLADNNFYDQQTINDIYANGMLFSNIFAQKLYDATSNDKTKQKSFIDMSLNSLYAEKESALSNKYSLLIYFVSLLSDKAYQNKIISQLETDIRFKYLALGIYGNRANNIQDIDIVFDKVDKGIYQISDLTWLLRYINLFIGSEEFYYSLYNRIIDYGSNGAILSLAFVPHILDDDNNSDPRLLSTAHKIFSLIDICDSDVLDNYDYYTTVKRYLSKNEDSELAVSLHNQFAKLIDTRDSDKYKRSSTIYGVLLQKYHDAIWPLLSTDLNDKVHLDKWSGFLGYNYIINSKSNNPPLSTLITKEEWLKWIDETPIDKNYAASRLIKMIQWYDDEANLYPLFAKILEKYWAENSEVEDVFSCRFHSFGFVGSGIPLFKQHIKVLNNIMALDNPALNEWAKDDIQHWNDQIKEETLESEHRHAIYE